MSAPSKKEAIRIIYDSAILYKANLSGKNVLFVTVDDDRASFFETSFQPGNFLHLTGVKSSISGERFLEAVLSGKIGPSNIEFTSGGTAELKLEILQRLMSIHVAARMIGDYDNSKPLLITDKFAGTVTMAMGFIQINNLYIPNTAMKKDVREITTQATRRKVAAIFVKPRNDSMYATLTYIAKGLTLDDDAFLSVLRERIDLQNLTAAFPIPRRSAPENE